MSSGEVSEVDSCRAMGGGRDIARSDSKGVANFGICGDTKVFCEAVFWVS